MEERARFILAVEARLPGTYHHEVIASAHRVIDRNDYARWAAPLKEMGGYRHDDAEHDAAWYFLNEDR